jgi:hypothetical protein
VIIATRNQEQNSNEKPLQKMTLYSPEVSLKNPKLLWWKLIAVWIGFLLLHFSYDTFPGPFFKLIGEENETTFFHMKMLFASYVIVSLIELIVRRSRIGSVDTFLYSRALIAVAFPWLTITMWFSAEAIGLKLPVIPWELIYANIFTLLGIYLALRMEELFEGVKFRPALKAMVILVFLTAILSYAAFSFTPPVHFFTTPPY